MKRSLALAGCVPVLAALAGGVRYWQRAVAFEPDTGLLTPGMPVNALVVAVPVLAAAVLFALSWLRAKDAPENYLAAFALPGKWMLALYVAAGALLVAAGTLCVLDYTQAITDEKSLARLVLGLALLPTGVSVALVGWLNGAKAEAKGRFAWPLLLPGYCACGWLIFEYQTRSIHPNIAGYVFILLAVACTAGFCYMAAAFSFERPRPLAALWTGSMSLVLLSMSGVDFALEDDRTPLLICLGYAGYVLAQTVCLLCRCARPAALERWTPPAGDETEDTQQTQEEVDAHE